MEAYDLIEFEGFQPVAGDTMPPLFDSKFNLYDTTNNGTFILDNNLDLNNQRYNVLLTVEKYEARQFYQVVDMIFNEFPSETRPLTSINIAEITSSFVPSTSYSDLINNPPVMVDLGARPESSGSNVTDINGIPAPIIVPSGSTAVNATVDYFTYTVGNQITYTGNQIEDIARANPFNVYFELLLDDVDRLNQIYDQNAIYRPTIDMIFRYNDWYINPRVIS